MNPNIYKEISDGVSKYERLKANKAQTETTLQRAQNQVDMLGKDIESLDTQIKALEESIADLADRNGLPVPVLDGSVPIDESRDWEESWEESYEWEASY